MKLFYVNRITLGVSRIKYTLDFCHSMEIHVYDTYVKAKDGHIMHFDVITGRHEIVLGQSSFIFATDGNQQTQRISVDDRTVIAARPDRPATSVKFGSNLAETVNCADNIGLSNCRCAHRFNRKTRVLRCDSRSLSDAYGRGEGATK